MFLTFSSSLQICSTADDPGHSSHTPEIHENDFTEQTPSSTSFKGSVSIFSDSSFYFCLKKCFLRASKNNLQFSQVSHLQSSLGILLWKSICFSDEIISHIWYVNSSLCSSLYKLTRSLIMIFFFFCSVIFFLSILPQYLTSFQPGLQ